MSILYEIWTQQFNIVHVIFTWLFATYWAWQWGYHSAEKFYKKLYGKDKE